MTGFDSKRQASRDLLEPQAEPVAESNPWRDAIDAQLFCLHLGTVESFPTAQDALAALIDWHVAVALDPEVSSDAQALIDRGAAVAEPLKINKDSIMGACSRAWCHPKNERKEMDVDLGVAIAHEVKNMLIAHGISIKGAT
jgi:hypothetical protein